jgi:hypothetical protein
MHNDARLKKALIQCYESLDKVIRSWKFTADGQYPLNRYRLEDFISLFGSGSGPRYVFTLNQDLFVERHCEVKGLRYLGIQPHGELGWRGGQHFD